jgi:NADPH:quinone reductase-like Zn-dependent oxidoreductase
LIAAETKEASCALIDWNASQASTDLSRLSSRPPQPGPGEAVVQIEARSLNYRDALILDNHYAVPARAGVVPISDGAGVVTAVGEGVTCVAPADRVCATYFPRWLDGEFTLAAAAEQFGCTRDGMLAELALVPAGALVKVPDHLSSEEACALPCAAVTAWAALTEPRRPLPSETVLTIGTGGVALFALQFAKLLGARVIAITSRANRVDLLERHGADAVIDSTARGDWEQAVRELTDGRGVDYVVETGSAETLPRSLASCAPQGHVALVAALGVSNLDTRALAAPVTIRRSYVGSRGHFEAMNRAIAQHRLRPVVDEIFSFERTKEAYEHFLAKRHIGKVVITA